MLPSVFCRGVWNLLDFTDVSHWQKTRHTVLLQFCRVQCTLYYNRPRGWLYHYKKQEAFSVLAPTSHVSVMNAICSKLWLCRVMNLKTNGHRNRIHNCMHIIYLTKHKNRVIRPREIPQTNAASLNEYLHTKGMFVISLRLYYFTELYTKPGVKPNCNAKQKHKKRTCRLGWKMKRQSAEQPRMTWGTNQPMQNAPAHTSVWAIFQDLA